MAYINQNYIFYLFNNIEESLCIAAGSPNITGLYHEPNFNKRNSQGRD